MSQVTPLRQRLQQSKVIPVIVIHQLEQAIPLARALVDGGLKTLEITLRTGCAVEAIAAIAAEVEGAWVGAGTVTNAAQYRAVVEAGAQFIVSPGATSALISEAKKYHADFLPGVATPSELMALMEAGINTCKFFPAEVYGGTAALKALGGPFPQAAFCPTGGVSLANLADYLALPNVLCVGGSWMLPADRIAAADWAAITALAAEAAARFDSLRPAQ